MSEDTLLSKALAAAKAMMASGNSAYTPRYLESDVQSQLADIYHDQRDTLPRVNYQGVTKPNPLAARRAEKAREAAKEAGYGSTINTNEPEWGSLTIYKPGTPEYNRQVEQVWRRVRDGERLAQDGAVLRRGGGEKYKIHAYLQGAYVKAVEPTAPAIYDDWEEQNRGKLSTPGADGLNKGVQQYSPRLQERIKDPRIPLDQSLPELFDTVTDTGGMVTRPKTYR